MKGYRHAVHAYIVPNVLKADKAAKKKRKRVRKSNIKKGSQYAQILESLQVLR